MPDGDDCGAAYRVIPLVMNVNDAAAQSHADKRGGEQAIAWPVGDMREIDFMFADIRGKTEKGNQCARITSDAFQSARSTAAKPEELTA